MAEPAEPSTAPRPAGHHVEVPRLRPLQFWGIVALAVVLFLLGQGPIWRHASDPRQLLLAIGWSYVPIPFLVAACLAWSRRLRFVPWMLSTVEVAGVKYLLTASFMIVLWALAGPTERRETVLVGAHGPPVRDAPAPTPSVIEPQSTGTIVGRVVGVSGALAYLSGGPEQLVFAPPERPLILHAGASGIEEGLHVVQTWQPLALISEDGRLHAIRGSFQDGGIAFNFPALATQPRERRLREALGMVELSCVAHRHPEQGRSWLLVTGNPFHALTGAAGGFRFEGVPAGRVSVSAWSDGRTATETVDVVAGAECHVTLELPEAESSP